MPSTVRGPMALALCASVVTWSAVAGAQVSPLLPHPAHAPLRAHAVLRYLDTHGTSHHLELWREGDARVVRHTDETLWLSVERTAGQEDRYTLLDLARRRRVHVSRVNLFRLGEVPSWETLTTLLAPSPALTRFESIAPPVGALHPAASCRWVRRTVASGPVDELCWSARWDMVLMVLRVGPHDTRTPTLEVTTLDANTPAPTPPAPSDLVTVNADQELSPDQD